MFKRFPYGELQECAGALRRKGGVLGSLCLFAMLTGCGASNAAHQNNSTPPASAETLTISDTLPQATQGSGYNGTISVMGGTAPYTFVVASGQLPTGLALGNNTGTVSGTPSQSGTYSFAVQVLDSKGTTKQKALQIGVATPAPTTPPSNPPTSNPPSSTGSSSGQSFTNVQHAGGWGQYGQGPPNFVDCSPSPCDGISFSMAQNVSNPSMSGQASEYSLGGTTAYSDALWNNHLIGPGSSQGMPDGNGTIVPGLHNFTYDVYFYSDDLSLSQAVEFDINQFFDGMGFIFGHECRIAGGNQWDVWDNQNAKWVPTGIPCYPNSNAWNHVTIQVQRTSNDQLLYQSITLNGQTSNLNWTFNHGSAPNWYGVTINYQMDGNSSQDSYNVYLDQLTFTYQ